MADAGKLTQCPYCGSNRLGQLSSARGCFHEKDHLCCECMTRVSGQVPAWLARAASMSGIFILVIVLLGAIGVIIDSVTQDRRLDFDAIKLCIGMVAIFGWAGFQVFQFGEKSRRQAAEDAETFEAMLARRRQIDAAVPRAAENADATDLSHAT